MHAQYYTEVHVPCSVILLLFLIIELPAAQKFARYITRRILVNTSSENL